MQELRIVPHELNPHANLLSKKDSMSKKDSQDKDARLQQYILERKNSLKKLRASSRVK